MVITAAYGRRYRTQEEFLRDWNAGKDFKIYSNTSSCYCSIRDFKDFEFEARYGLFNEHVFILKG